MKKLTLLFTSLLLISSYASASQSILSQHNLILIGDYNFTGGDVQGSALIGGDLNTKVAAEFGSRLPNTNTAVDAVTVVGNVGNPDGGNVNVRVLRDNNFVYGGTLYQGTNIELNDGDDGQVINDPSLTINDVVQELYNTTKSLSLLDANGSFNNGDLAYSGTGDVAVFNVAASDIFSQNSNLSLSGTTGRSVIINVSADANNQIHIPTSVNLNNGFNGASAFSSIIWNFFDAQVIDFGSLNVKGAVLAPYADTFGSANVDGAYAALSFTGAREYHNFPFTGNIPNVDVSAPSVVGLFVVFGVVVAAVRSRRKSMLLERRFA